MSKDAVPAEFVTTVTPDHIVQGTPGNESSCALAVSLIEQFPGFRVEVSGADTIYLYSSDDNDIWHIVQKADPGDPVDVDDFIVWFDGYRDVAGTQYEQEAAAKIEEKYGAMNRQHTFHFAAQWFDSSWESDDDGDERQE